MTMFANIHLQMIQQANPQCKHLPRNSALACTAATSTNEETRLPVVTTASHSVIRFNGCQPNWTWNPSMTFAQKQNIYPNIASRNVVFLEPFWIALLLLRYFSRGYLRATKPKSIAFPETTVHFCLDLTTTLSRMRARAYLESQRPSAVLIHPAYILWACWGLLFADPFCSIPIWVLPLER